MKIYLKANTKEDLLEAGVVSVSEDGKEILYKPSKHLDVVKKATQYSDEKNYYHVHIGNFQMCTHRLVYIWFKGEIPAKHCVDHIDDDKQNNNIKNLQILTWSENIKKNRKVSACGTKLIPCSMKRPREYYEEKVKHYLELCKKDKKYSTSLYESRARLRYWDLHRNEYENFIYEQSKIEQNKKMYRRVARCRRLAKEIGQYYKNKNVLNEWHIFSELRRKEELTMNDCYAIELTYSLIEKEINEYEENK